MSISVGDILIEETIKESQKKQSQQPEQINQSQEDYIASEKIPESLLEKLIDKLATPYDTISKADYDKPFPAHVKIKKQLYYQDDNYFGIYSCVLVSNSTFNNKKTFDCIRYSMPYYNFTIKGTMEKKKVGEEVKLYLMIEKDEKYGLSYKITQPEIAKLESKKEQFDFLSTIMKEEQVKEIFKNNENEPDIIEGINSGRIDITNIKGIKEATKKRIQAKIRKLSAASFVISRLSKFGITEDAIMKLLSYYGNNQNILLKVLYTNPYVLLKLPYYGWSRVDKIALSITDDDGNFMIDRYSKPRIMEAIRFCLFNEEQNGHTYTKYDQVINKACDLCEISREKLLSIYDITNIDDYGNVLDRVGDSVLFGQEEELLFDDIDDCGYLGNEYDYDKIDIKKYENTDSETENNKKLFDFSDEFNLYVDKCSSDSPIDWNIYRKQTYEKEKYVFDRIMELYNNKQPEDDNNDANVEHVDTAHADVKHGSKEDKISQDNFNETFLKGISSVEAIQGFEFTEEQKNTIKRAVLNNITVICGKGGTGKSSIIKAIHDIAVLQKKTVKICTLSGKASSRLSELGLTSMTIHRLIGIKINGNSSGEELSDDAYNDDSDLVNGRVNSDYLIIDETSMVNTSLFYTVLKNTSERTKIILVGDSGQLEPIGYGSVFVDLVNNCRKVLSDVIIELTQVHRQAKKSGILTVANSVRDGLPYSWGNKGEKTVIGDLKDMIFYNMSDSDSINKFVMSVIAHYIKTNDGSLPQVIVPMKTRGLNCTNNLNKQIQKTFNGDALHHMKHSDNIFGLHDLVMQTSNNYDKNVFNGETGQIIGFGENHKNEKVCRIRFNGDAQIKEYTTAELSQLELAYAMTVHKSQGSQFPDLIFILDSSSYIMLNRGLLYTGLTRAKSKCVLITTPKLFNIAVKNNTGGHRRTYIKENIRKIVL